MNNKSVCDDIAEIMIITAKIHTPEYPFATAVYHFDKNDCSKHYELGETLNWCKEERDKTERSVDEDSVYRYRAIQSYKSIIAIKLKSQLPLWRRVRLALLSRPK